MNRFSIAWITMGFSLGIILGYWSLFWVVFGFVALLILAGCFKANLFLRLFIFGIIVLFGFFYFQLKESWQKENLKLNAYEHEVELIGTIDSDLKQRKGLNSAVASFELKLERINDDGWKNSFGRVLVNIYQDDFDAFYGDRIYLVGNLSRPYNFSPGSNFSYVQYLSRQRIYHIVHVKKSQSVEVLESGQAFSLRLFSLKLRNQLKRVYEKYLSAQDAAMMNAFLLGDRSQVGGLTKQVFVETGTAHILAISGMNVGIVAFVILLLLRIVCMNRQLRYALTITLLIFYALMTGASPSVVRATIMAVVFLSAFLLEREADTLNSLFVAALIILLINPFNLFDIGFQLSFVCVFAIIEIYPMFIKQKEATWLERILIHPFILSLSVWIFVGGLIVYYFKIVTPVTVLANLVVVPLSSLIVALGFGLLLSASVSSFLAGCFAICLNLSLKLLMAMVLLFHQIPYGFFYTSIVGWAVVFALYLGLFLVFFYIKYKYQKLNLSADQSGFFRF